MNKILIFFVSLPFFGCAQNKQDLNFKNINIISEFQFDTKNKELDKVILDNSFKNILGESDLYSRNGEYWENMDFRLYGLSLVEAQNSKSVFVLKKIQMIDGELSELYLVKIGLNNKLIEIKKVGKHESTGNCENDFSLKISKMKAEVIQTETCEVGSQNDDENEETTKTKSEKTFIDLNN